MICFFQPLPVVTTANTSSHIEVIVCLMTNQSSAEYFELCVIHQIRFFAMCRYRAHLKTFSHKNRMKRDMHNFVADVYENWKAKNTTLEALTAVLADWYPKPVSSIDVNYDWICSRFNNFFFLGCIHFSSLSTMDFPRCSCCFLALDTYVYARLCLRATTTRY